VSVNHLTRLAKGLTRGRGTRDNHKREPARRKASFQHRLLSRSKGGFIYRDIIRARLILQRISAGSASERTRIGSPENLFVPLLRETIVTAVSARSVVEERATCTELLNAAAFRAFGLL